MAVLILKLQGFQASAQLQELAAEQQAKAAGWPKALLAKRT